MLIVGDENTREVAMLVNREQSAETYSIFFDASQLPSGNDYYRLEAGA